MISNILKNQILQLLNLEQSAPTAEFLDQILFSYTRTIPWESASRNVRRIEKHNSYDDCPRYPEEFWNLAFSQRTGGTCFETNLALLALLTSLGYDGYLTINNMSLNVGCHTAIVVLIDGKKWLFDAGYPLECVIPLDREERTTRVGKFLTYHTVPTENDTFQILRSRHPKPYIFTLYDTPIPLEAYKQATAEDYRPEGNFNNSVVINKVVDEKMLRFSTWPEDVMFEAFSADPAGGMATREVYKYESGLAAQLAQKFGMPQQLIAQALDIVESPVK